MVDFEDENQYDEDIDDTEDGFDHDHDDDFVHDHHNHGDDPWKTVTRQHHQPIGSSGI